MVGASTMPPQKTEFEPKTEAETVAGVTRSTHLSLDPREKSDRLFEQISFGLSLFPFGRGGFTIKPLRRLERLFGTAVAAIVMLEPEKDHRLPAELPGMDQNNPERTASDTVLSRVPRHRSINLFAGASAGLRSPLQPLNRRQHPAEVRA